MPAHVESDAAAAAYAAEVARLAHGAVVEATASLGLRSDWSHRMRRGACMQPLRGCARCVTMRHARACRVSRSGL